MCPQAKSAHDALQKLYEEALKTAEVSINSHTHAVYTHIHARAFTRSHQYSSSHQPIQTPYLCGQERQAVIASLQDHLKKAQDNAAEARAPISLFFSI